MIWFWVPPMRNCFYLDGFWVKKFVYFGANAKNVVKMRENAKTQKVKKWRIFPIKVAYFSVCFGVFKFSHFLRIFFALFMRLFRTCLWWCYTQPCESSSGIVFGVGLFPGLVGGSCPCRWRQKHCHLGLGVAIHWTKVSLIWTIRCWIANKNTKVSKKNSKCLWYKIGAFWFFFLMAMPVMS